MHTFIRVPAGALLTASAIGALDAHGGTAGTLVAAILGGSLAAGAHLTKSSTRALANTSPEPFSNIGLSLGEDLLVPGGLALAVLHPYVFVALLLVMVAIGRVARPEDLALHPAARRPRVAARADDRLPMTGGPRIVFCAPGAEPEPGFAEVSSKGCRTADVRAWSEASPGPSRLRRRVDAARPLLCERSRS